MPEINEKGDLFDVFSNEDVKLLGPQAGVQHTVDNNKVRDVSFTNALIGLGFAMEIPKGFKANLYPRSSTYKTWGIICGDSVGQIDNSYCGNNDEWKVNAVAMRSTEIHKGDKIAQFEIVPSSKATLLQKLKWLFSSKIEFIETDNFNNPDRNGFGSTGYEVYENI